MIVDVLDECRVLVDGPTTGLSRAVYPVKRLSLTDIKIDILRGAKTGTVRKAVEKSDVQGKWDKSSWGKKIASHKTRANLTDFERFSVMIHRKRRSYAIRHAK